MSNMIQKVTLFTTGELFSEKSMPSTWLYPQATRHVQYTPFRLILNTHIFFTQHWYGGISDLLVLRHTCCLFMSVNSLRIASRHFSQHVASGWFQASLKEAGPSGTGTDLVVTIIKSMRKFKCSAMLTWEASLMILLASSLELFHSSNNFCI